MPTSLQPCSLQNLLFEFPDLFLLTQSLGAQASAQNAFKENGQATSTVTGEQIKSEFISKVRNRRNKIAPDNKETLWKYSFYLEKQYFLPFNSQIDPVGFVKNLDLKKHSNKVQLPHDRVNLIISNTFSKTSKL
jgi:hypothetical protein